MSRKGCLERPWTELQTRVDKAERLCNSATLMSKATLEIGSRQEPNSMDRNGIFKRAMQAYHEALALAEHSSLARDLGISDDEEMREVMGGLFDITTGSAPPLLFLAACAGHKGVVEMLLDHGVSAHARGPLGNDTPLICAARSGHLAVIKPLLDRGVPIAEGPSLALAAKNGRKAVVKLLLDRGAEIELGENELPSSMFNRDRIQTPLWLAAEAGHQAVVELLLNRGAAIEAAGRGGRTPLMVAAERGHEATVRLLLSRGAASEAHGLGLLQRAAHNGHEHIVRLLLDMDAEIEAKDKKGQTPLLTAADAGRKGIVKLLLDRGVSVEATNNYGQTPLHLAASKGNQIFRAFLILDLLGGPGTEEKDEHGRARHYVNALQILWGKEAIVALLLDRGAAVEAKDKAGRTPLLEAAELGKTDDMAMFKSFLRRSAVVQEAKDESDREALLEARPRMGREEDYRGKTTVEMLLDRGADIEAQDNDGRTPWVLAKETENEDIADLLVSRGAPPRPFRPRYLATDHESESE
ncbi:hypothetical protein OQA88_790 [Cercophora sp. LCS_1]